MRSSVTMIGCVRQVLQKGRPWLLVRRLGGEFVRPVAWNRSAHPSSTDGRVAACRRILDAIALAEFTEQRSTKGTVTVGPNRLCRGQP